MNESKIQEVIQKCKKYIDDKLMPVINEKGGWLCGNLFTEHNENTYTDLYKDKQKNFVDILNKEVGITNVMEIGFNAGFSTLLMLLSNSRIKVTCVDLCEHPYALECYKILKKDFGERIMLHIGDSREVLPRFKGPFDFIHIDGCHLTDVAEIDIINSYHLSREGTLIVMDDYDCDEHPHNIKGFWEGYSKKYQMKEYPLRFPNIYHNAQKVFLKWTPKYDDKNKCFRYLL